MSFLVLSRTDVVTHSALNIFRRVVVILFSLFFFNLELTTINYLGILIAIFGALGFTYEKRKEKNVKGV